MQKVKQFAIERRELCVRTAMVLLVVLATVGMLIGTVFAETTYYIHDGENKLVYKTDATEPTEVLEQAGLALSAGDQFITQESFGSATITIRRAVEVIIDQYGKPTSYVAYEDETLGDVLHRLELSWNEGDVLSHALDTRVSDGLYMSISYVEVKEEVYNDVIAYESVQVKDDNLAKGVTKLRTEGVNGEKQVTASVTYVNGQETGREILNEEVLVPAVDEVVAVGTGKNVIKSVGNVTIGKNTITLPSGEVLHYTHSAGYKATAYTHTDAGCDMITATGTTVHHGTVAVDPRMIPYGTRMFIMTNDGSYIYGVGTAEDCGGGIKGNRLDLYFSTYSQCIQFGVRNCTVYFLG